MNERVYENEASQPSTKYEKLDEKCIVRRSKKKTQKTKEREKYRNKQVNNK